MGGIGQQCEAVGNKTCNRFDDHEAQCEHERKRETLCGLVGEIANVGMGLRGVLTLISLLSQQSG